MEIETTWFGSILDGLPLFEWVHDALMVCILQLAPWNQCSYLWGFFSCKHLKSTLDDYHGVVVNSLGFRGYKFWLFNLLIVSPGNQTNLHLLSVEGTNKNSTHFTGIVRNKWDSPVKSLVHSNYAVDFNCDFIFRWPSLHFWKELFIIIK